YHIPTATVSALYGSLEDGIGNLISRDTIVFDSTFNQQVKAMTMFAIDPLGPDIEIYARYGLIKRMDIGFALANGVKVFDARFQFLGSVGSLKDPSREKFNGSIGVQFSWQEYKLPSFLGDLQSVLKYELKRKDLLIPLAFSHSFGLEEKYGAVSYGLAYGRSWITYDYHPNIVYELVSGYYQPISEVPRDETGYGTYGCFGNIKLGYKYLYGLLGLALYYQDYGRYNLYKNIKEDFQGVTLVPNFGFQVSF
ncbi:hypothetical protein ACFL5V_01085, partial [Fibrobacterota bacterium]